MTPMPTVVPSSRSASIVLLAIAMFLVPGPQAFAERADKDKPAIINADQSNGDDQNHVYTGDVVLTKGTIILRADQLTLKEDPEGYNFGTAVSTQANRLAYFKQKREGVDEFIEGQAERIEYDEKSDTVRLFNRAIVKRLVAGRDADESRGDRIDYNSRTEGYTVLSTGAPSTGPGDRKRQTTTILQPKIKPGASNAPAGNAVPPSTASPPIELRKAPTVEARPGS